MQEEKLSALLDGELDRHESGRLFDAVRRNVQLARKWDEYCLIGDVLRDEHTHCSDLTQRVMAELQDDVVIFAPLQTPSSAAAGKRAAQWGLGLLPIAASVMGVAVVGWIAYAMSGADQSAPMLAVAQPVATVANVQPASVPVAVVAPRADDHIEYVFVHQAMKGGGPVPGGIQYVRTVADTSRDSHR